MVPSWATQWVATTEIQIKTSAKTNPGWTAGMKLAYNENKLEKKWISG
jgi:hypothetical protein